MKISLIALIRILTEHYGEVRINQETSNNNCILLEVTETVKINDLVDDEIIEDEDEEERTIVYHLDDATIIEADDSIYNFLEMIKNKAIEDLYSEQLNELLDLNNPAE